MLKLIKEKFNSGMGKDIAWTFSLQIIIMLCSFAINKLLASRLSIDDFGQYNLIKRSVQVLSFVMLAGVGIAIPRYIPLYRNSKSPKRITPLLFASLLYVLGISLVVILGCILFNKQMQNFIIGQSDNMLLLLVALGYAFALAMSQVVFAYYRGTGDFKWYNGTQLTVQLAIVLPLILIPALTVSDVFVSWLIITFLLVLFFSGREFWCKRDRLFPLSTPESPISSHLKTIAKYSSGRLVADFFLFSLAAFPLIYISNTLGLQQTAYYSVGITFVSMVIPVFSFMGIILLPYISECIARHEMQSASRLISRLALLYIAISILAIAFIFLFTDRLTRLLFAESYVAASGITCIMALSILPQALYMLYRNPIDAISVIPYNTIILGICLVLMTVCFHFSSTLIQLAWAYFAVSCLQGLLSFLTWQVIKIRQPLQEGDTIHQ